MEKDEKEPIKIRVAFKVAIKKVAIKNFALLGLVSIPA